MTGEPQELAHVIRTGESSLVLLGLVLPGRTLGHLRTKFLERANLDVLT